MNAILSDAFTAAYKCYRSPHAAILYVPTPENPREIVDLSCSKGLT